MEEPPPVPRKPSISLWGISSKLRIKIVSACNVNAEMKVCQDTVTDTVTNVTNIVALGTKMSMAVAKL